MATCDRVARPLLALMLTLAMLAALAAAQAAQASDLTVRVAPNHLRLAHGATAQLVADVFSADGSPSPAVLTWEVLPAHLGVVSPDGTFTAQGIGRGLVRVTARAGGDVGVGHAMVTVTPVREALVAVVTVDPPQSRVDAGGRQAFHARATDPATGEPVEGVTFEWRVVPPELGRVDADGVFQAGEHPGSGSVVVRVIGADVSGLGQSRLVVGPAAPADLDVQVAPQRAFVPTGETRRFQAVVMQDGERVDPQPLVEWSILPPDLGTIGPDGTLEAGNLVTDGRVVATVASATGVSRGYASVAVRPAPEHDLALQIRPREAVVVPGGQQHFEAAVLGAHGEIEDARVEWEVKPAGAADISPDGVLTVHRTAATNRTPVDGGEVIARVRVGDVVATDHARFVVRVPPPDSWLRVLPARVQVAPGEQVSFTAQVAGRDAPVPDEIVWRVPDVDIGTITPDGLFTASETASNAGAADFGGRDGVVEVTAVLPDGRRLEGSAVVIVRPVTADTRVSLHPEEVNDLHPGDAASFRLVVNGRDAQSLGVPVRWLVDPPSLGTISAIGEFRAADVELAGPVTGRIVGEVTLGANAVFRAASTVRISPTPLPTVAHAYVTVDPSRILLTPGKGVELHVTVLIPQPDGPPLQSGGDFPLVFGENMTAYISPANLGRTEEQRDRVRFVAGDAEPAPGRPFTGQVTVRVGGVLPGGQVYEGRASAAVTITRRLSSALESTQ